MAYFIYRVGDWYLLGSKKKVIIVLYIVIFAVYISSLSWRIFIASFIVINSVKIDVVAGVPGIDFVV